jgi:hypothetical protein
MTEMSINLSLERGGIKHKLSEYPTLELVSVLTHVEDSRRQIDRFVESITAELTRRGNTREKVLRLNSERRIAGAARSTWFPRRRKQTASALASARRWIG